MPYLNSAVLSAGTLAQHPQPTIPADNGLLLRPWTSEDVPAVYQAFQDPVMHQWHVRAADSEDEVRGWID
ncbi:GNAT family N-acetyltransferase, partial [Streptomyces spongiae]